MGVTKLKLPSHLRKYVVEQDYNRYTPIDHAVWRFILRQLKSFLSTHAHESYLSGLEKTGIEIERIPKIKDISEKIEKFGWFALPVSGFIPPAAFMEMQSLGVLPIASDMRTLDHLLYTPAPDIVHEAAGHAPILIQPEFAEYLKKYAQIAKKAILSKEDLNLYEAIRELSDVKENPNSTAEDIQKSEKKLTQATESLSHVSEAAQLGRMNWWTAEYGLIGSLENPKIFGAGLLSSLGEARECLKKKVKKVPLTVDCIDTSYDITEPQPQLFVAPDFKSLSDVLEQMAERMSFRRGGVWGVLQAIRAQTVNTLELSSGLQISGEFSEALIGTELITPEKVHNEDSLLKVYETLKDQPVLYVKSASPAQLSYKDMEIPGHSRFYHSHGYSSPLGFLKEFPDRCPSTLTQSDWQKLGLKYGATVNLEFNSGFKLQGVLQSQLQKENRVLILSFGNCTITYQNKKYFEPSWGVFDLALGEKIISVFGGPADRESYGELTGFTAARVPAKAYSAQEFELFNLYQKVRNLREQKISSAELIKNCDEVLNTLDKHPNDWLLRLEVFELLDDATKTQGLSSQADELKKKIKQQITNIKQNLPPKKTTIEDGQQLVGMI